MYTAGSGHCGGRRDHGWHTGPEIQRVSIAGRVVGERNAESYQIGNS